jgi:hypothetical protein
LYLASKLLLLKKRLPPPSVAAATKSNPKLNGNHSSCRLLGLRPTVFIFSRRFFGSVAGAFITRLRDMLNFSKALSSIKRRGFLEPAFLLVTIAFSSPPAIQDRTVASDTR